MQEYFWLKITFVVFDSAIKKRYVSRCFQKTTPWSKNMQMKGSKEILTCRFISRSWNCQPEPCSLLQSHSPGAFFRCSPWALLCKVGLKRPSTAHIFKACYSQSPAYCPTDPAHLRVSFQSIHFGLRPPQRLFIPLSKHKIWIPDQD